MVQQVLYNLPLPEDIHTYPEAKRLLLDVYKDWVIPVSLKMLGMYPQHVSEQKRLSEQLIKSLKACGDNFKQAKQLVKAQLAIDSSEQYGGVLGHANKYTLLGLLEDDELVPHL